MKKEFIWFLKNKRLWAKFQREFIKYNNHNDISGHLDEVKDIYWIEFAFDFDCSLIAYSKEREDSYDLWDRTNNDWILYLEFLNEDMPPPKKT